MVRLDEGVSMAQVSSDVGGRAAFQVDVARLFFGLSASDGYLLVSFSYYDVDSCRFIDRPASTSSATTTPCTRSSTTWCRSISNPMPTHPKVLVIGPDSAGNLLEVIVLVLADDRMIAIHAMKLRRHFYELLPGEEGSP
jgi:hypothetical protein